MYRTNTWIYWMCTSDTQALSRALYELNLKWDLSKLESRNYSIWELSLDYILRVTYITRNTWFAQQRSTSLQDVRGTRGTSAKHTPTPTPPGPYSWLFSRVFLICYIFCHWWASYLLLWGSRKYSAFQGGTQKTSKAHKMCFGKLMHLLQFNKCVEVNQNFLNARFSEGYFPLQQNDVSECILIHFGDSVVVVVLAC